MEVNGNKKNTLYYYFMLVYKLFSVFIVNSYKLTERVEGRGRGLLSSNRSHNAVQIRTEFIVSLFNVIGRFTRHCVQCNSFLYQVDSIYMHSILVKFMLALFTRNFKGENVKTLTCTIMCCLIILSTHAFIAFI